MKDILIEKLIPGIILFFDRPDSMTKQSEGIRQIESTQRKGI